MPTGPEHHCCVIISSCDSFSDLWQPFFRLFFRFWPRCPYEVFLVANYLQCADPRVRTIAVGRDRGWASNMQQALSYIRTPYIIYLQEDYLLTAAVDESWLHELVTAAQTQQAGCLRIYPCPGPDEPLAGVPGLGVLAPQAPYRVSLQAAIWRKDVLQQLLRPGESGWEMEVRGTARASRCDVPFLSVERNKDASGALIVPIPYFCTAVERGCWVPEAVAFCRSQGIAVDLSRRPLKGQEQPPGLPARLYRRVRAVGQCIRRRFRGG